MSDPHPAASLPDAAADRRLLERDPMVLGPATRLEHGLRRAKSARYPASSLRELSAA